MKKMFSMLGCLALSLALSFPALADGLGQKIAYWCSNASPGNTLTLSASESDTYDQKTSRGFIASPEVRFEFENGQGVCTITYVSMGGEQSLSTEMAVIHKSGDTLTMGSRIEK